MIRDDFLIVNNSYFYPGSTGTTKDSSRWSGPRTGRACSTITLPKSRRERGRRRMRSERAPRRISRYIVVIYHENNVVRGLEVWKRFWPIVKGSVFRNADYFFDYVDPLTLYIV